MAKAYFPFLFYFTTIVPNIFIPILYPPPPRNEGGAREFVSLAPGADDGNGCADKGLLEIHYSLKTYYL